MPQTSAHILVVKPSLCFDVTIGLLLVVVPLQYQSQDTREVRLLDWTALNMNCIWSSHPWWLSISSRSRRVNSGSGSVVAVSLPPRSDSIDSKEGSECGTIEDGWVRIQIQNLNCWGKCEGRESSGKKTSLCDFILLYMTIPNMAEVNILEIQRSWTQPGVELRPFFTKILAWTTFVHFSNPGAKNPSLDAILEGFPSWSSESRILQSIWLSLWLEIETITDWEMKNQ